MNTNIIASDKLIGLFYIPHIHFIDTTCDIIPYFFRTYYI